MQKSNLKNFNGIVILLILIITSCYFDKEDLLYGESICDTTLVSFSDEILPIINNNCATVGCHIQGGSGIAIFENYLQIKAKVDDGSFFSRVIDLQNMPPDNPLSECQKLHIQQWVIDGAIDN